MPQFDVTTYASQVFWLIICFGFLCVVMARYLVPRLTTVLEAREKRLQEDWHQAKTLIQEDEFLKKENLTRLTEARGKAHALLYQTIQEAHHNKTRRIAILDEELLVKTKKIRDDLEAHTQLIRENMEPLVSQVVTTTARRVLGQPLTQSQIKAAVRTVLKKQE